MTLPESHVDSLAEFDRLPPTAYVETDRFCDSCGYNLRTQPVRQESRTGLLLCRCPECGRFQYAREAATAGRLWLQRLSIVFTVLWVVVLLSLGFGLGAAQVALPMITLDELTSYNRSSITIVNTNRGTYSIPLPTTQTSRWQLTVRDEFNEYELFITLMYSMSFLAGLAVAMLLVLACLHWRRWVYYLVIPPVTVITAVIVWRFWASEVPYLEAWGLTHILRHAAAHLAGGLVGVAFGRTFARLALSILLPARLRQHLAFLWLVDGKQPPHVAKT